METLDLLNSVEQPLEIEIEERAKLQDDCTRLEDAMSEYIIIFKREYGTPVDIIQEGPQATYLSLGTTASFYRPLEFQTIDSAKCYLSLGLQSLGCQ